MKKKLEEYRYCLILKHTPNLGPRTWKKLISYFKSAKNACENSDEWKKLGIRADAIQNFLEKKWAKNVENEFLLFEKSKAQVLVLSSEDYPYLLKEIPDPPLTLYYMGNKNLLNNPCIAIVGSRKTTSYGLQIAHKFSKELSEKGITIVSGFAIGIDTVAHKAALLSVGSTIAVLGCGIDINYPAQNYTLRNNLIEKGLILSEFAPNTPPSSENFPIRNRIISGISLGVLIVQAAQKSGSLITSKYALEQNRLIFSVPGPLNNPMFAGNNNLLREGAILVRDATDILEEIPPYVLTNNCKKSFSTESINSFENSKGTNGTLEQKVLEIIMEKGQVGVDEICDELEMKPSIVTSLLIQLEVLGKVKRVAQNFYSLTL